MTYALRRQSRAAKPTTVDQEDIALREALEAVERTGSLEQARALVDLLCLKSESRIRGS